MKQVIIENPVINSPYKEPSCHFKFNDEGITNEIVEKRRVSSYFMPVPKPRKRSRKYEELELFKLGTEWKEDRIKENEEINRIRGRVKLWRDLGYPHITKTTKRLLEYWKNPNRDPRLFFCQIEAVETAIYIAEAAKKNNDQWIENLLRDAGANYNPGIFRIALKMATGSGKTVVMAMLIAWHTLNKAANPKDRRFTDSFLIVTPGITIKDRLRVLIPNDPQNYYQQMDLVPPELKENLGKARMVVTNFHTFLLREKYRASRLTKDILATNGESPFKETPVQMVRRVCRELGGKKNIIVINDEAHHCYRQKIDGEKVKLKGDERKESERREEHARVWISGLDAVQKRIGIKAVYDLSATPFFLSGSGYKEGTLFPWVVSDFSLIDAIECGIVKVPRVPVSDDAMVGELPTYRDLWPRIKEDLPKKGRKSYKLDASPTLPQNLEGALHTLYGNYEKYYRQWEKSTEKDQPPPVMIIVCNNTTVSKLVFDWVAGWEKKISEDQTIIVPGELPVFSNEENGRWRVRPNTILIDSEQLESGEALSSKFKKVAAAEIEELKQDYRARFPGRDIKEISDADLLREVMNTVGKPGKLGEQIKCVVSVSMLTEGWDANTVTHILGVRAFGTQLLCEQVVGRGLRRRSYVPNDDGMFEPEYAEVYGIPFSFIPCSGTAINPAPPKPLHRVCAMDDRKKCQITFPRVSGYKYDFKQDKLPYNFTEESRYVLSTRIVPTMTEVAPIVGESDIHILDLEKYRIQEVAFKLAKFVLEKYFRNDEKTTDELDETEFTPEVQVFRFPQIIEITRKWLSECVICKDQTFPQMLLITQLARNAADKIHRSIVGTKPGRKTLRPILKRYDSEGSTDYVEFNTTRPVYQTDPDKCHINYVVADTETWEQKVAHSLENMNEVEAYVKNDHLGFAIPYTIKGQEKRYYPDFIVRIDDGHGKEDLLNLIIEVTGQRKEDKAAKVETARTLWVPAVNNFKKFGRWVFLEILDPWNIQNEIREFIKSSDN